MRKLILLFMFCLFSLGVYAQTDPKITSWLQNTTFKGKYWDGPNLPINLTDHNILANCQSIQYSNDWVYVKTTGMPSYTIGPYLDGNINEGGNQNVIFKFPRNPTENMGTKTTTSLGTIGYFINGVSMFDYADGVSYKNSTGTICGGPVMPVCTGDGVWNRDAIKAELLGFDCSKGHPAGTQYHHHQNPTAFDTDLNVLSTVCTSYDSDGLYVINPAQHSPLLGFAKDGYPVYGPYAYKNTNGTGGIVRMKSGYQLRNITVRTHYADGTNVIDGPAVNATYYLGYFKEDYEYIANADPDYLNQYNMRFCVTPEYPAGTYAYFCTVDANHNAYYPYMIGSAYFGNVTGAIVTSITETTRIYSGLTPESYRGNALNLDGTDDYVYVNNTSAYNIPVANENYTIEAWIYADAMGGGAGANKGIVIWGNLGGTKTGTGLWLSNTGIGAPWGGMGNTLNYTSGSIISAWHHVATSYDGTTRKIYLDGVLVASDTPTGHNVTNTASFYIGRNGTNYFDGMIDEVRIWNTARTLSEIRENMHLTLAGNEEGLRSYYQFNETSGDVSDVVSRNTGTATNIVGTGRATSTLSIAKGVANRVTVSGAGSTVLGNATINFTAMSAPATDEEFVAYQLYDRPYNNLSGVTSTASNYWLIRQFGTQTFSYNQMTYTLPSGNTISAADETTPLNFKLYKRTTNSGGTWGSIIGTGTSASNTSKQIVYSLSPAQTSFSEFNVVNTGTSPLPITLVSFVGERINEEQVQLRWVTSSETNNLGFEIEQSKNGQSFEKVAFVEGKGNSNSRQEYFWVGKNAFASYYRLKQVDKNGTFNYSPMVFVKGEDSKLTVKIFPNPASDMIAVQLGDLVRETHKLELIDLNGVVVKTAYIKQGQTLAYFDTQTVYEGVYFIRISGTHSVSTRKVVITK